MDGDIDRVVAGIGISMRPSNLLDPGQVCRDDPRRDRIVAPVDGSGEVRDRTASHAVGEGGQQQIRERGRCLPGWLVAPQSGCRQRRRCIPAGRMAAATDLIAETDSIGNCC